MGLAARLGVHASGPSTAPAALPAGHAWGAASHHRIVCDVSPHTRIDQNNTSKTCSQTPSLKHLYGSALLKVNAERRQHGGVSPDRPRHRKVGTRRPRWSLIFAEGSLFFCVLHDLLLHVQTLPLAHGVHVLPGLVLGIGLFPEVQVLLLGGRHPEGVAGNDLVREGDRMSWIRQLHSFQTAFQNSHSLS